MPKQKKSVSFTDENFDLLPPPEFDDVDDLIKRRKEELRIKIQEEMGLPPVNYPPPMPPNSFQGSELGHPSHYSPYQASSSFSPYPNNASSEDSSKS